jgi:hypothetical protein
MELNWQEFVGPTTLSAKGFSGVFVISNRPAGSTLYLMDEDEPLCPINKERAKMHWELANCEEAKDKALEVQKRIGGLAVKLIAKLEEVVIEQAVPSSSGDAEAVQDRQPGS